MTLNLSAVVMGSSSPAVIVLNPNVLRLPVQPSHSDYYEAGLTKGFFGQLRLDANFFGVSREIMPTMIRC
jgi:hypothetical protein